MGDTPTNGFVKTHSNNRHKPNNASTAWRGSVQNSLVALGSLAWAMDVCQHVRHLGAQFFQSFLSFCDTFGTNTNVYPGQERLITRMLQMNGE